MIRMIVNFNYQSLMNRLSDRWINCVEFLYRFLREFWKKFNTKKSYPMSHQSLYIYLYIYFNNKQLSTVKVTFTNLITTYLLNFIAFLADKLLQFKWFLQNFFIIYFIDLQNYENNLCGFWLKKILKWYCLVEYNYCG